MATSYALPLNGSGVHSHHGHGHTRSHHRKAVPERLPLVPTSINGALHLNGRNPQKEMMSDMIMPHAHSRSLPLNTWSDTRQSNRQEFCAISSRDSRIPSRVPDPETGKSASHTHLQRDSYGFRDLSAAPGHDSISGINKGISR